MTANDIYVIGIIIFYVFYYYFNVFRAHSTPDQPKSIENCRHRGAVSVGARGPNAREP